MCRVKTGSPREMRLTDSRALRLEKEQQQEGAMVEEKVKRREDARKCWLRALKNTKQVLQRSEGRDVDPPLQALHLKAEILLNLRLPQASL